MGNEDHDLQQAIQLDPSGGIYSVSVKCVCAFDLIHYSKIPKGITIGSEEGELPRLIVDMQGNFIWDLDYSRTSFDAEKWYVIGINFDPNASSYTREFCLKLQARYNSQEDESRLYLRFSQLPQ